MAASSNAQYSSCISIRLLHVSGHTTSCQIVVPEQLHAFVFVRHVHSLPSAGIALALIEWELAVGARAPMPSAKHPIFQQTPRCNKQ